MLCVLALSFALPVQAQTSRLYFAGYMGLNTYGDNSLTESGSGIAGDIEFDNTLSFAGALGLRITKQIRAEAEISHRKADLNTFDIQGGASVRNGGDVTSLIYMLNLMYDFDLDWRNFQPFVSAGFGFASHEAHIIDASGFAPDATDDSMSLAWSLGGGLKYRISDNTAFTGNYRYLGTQDIQIDTYDMEYSSHEFRVGLEYDIPVRDFTPAGLVAYINSVACVGVFIISPRSTRRKKRRRHFIFLRGEAEIRRAVISGLLRNSGTPRL